MRRFVVFACMFATAFACSCFPSHPQQEFCRSHFVLRAKVVIVPTVKPNISPFDDFDQLVYTINVTKIFRGSDKVKKSSGYDEETHQAKLHTPRRSSSCSIALSENKIYLLGGSLSSGGKLRADDCSIVRPWGFVSQQQKLNLEHYKPNCECSIETCSDEQECKVSKKTVCKFDRFSPDYRCTTKYQYCKFSYASRTCEWRATVDYKKCLQDMLP